MALIFRGVHIGALMHRVPGSGAYFGSTEQWETGLSALRIQKARCDWQAE